MADAINILLYSVIPREGVERLLERRVRAVVLGDVIPREGVESYSRRFGGRLWAFNVYVIPREGVESARPREADPRTNSEVIPREGVERRNSRCGRICCQGTSDPERGS